MVNPIPVNVAIPYICVQLDPEGNLVETYNSITKQTSPKITSKIAQFLQKDS